MGVQYNVAPRWTCGSPAMVNPRIARQVAHEEKRAHEIYLEGAYGEAEKKRAEEEGLALISFTMKETRKGWEVEDLITGEKHFWPFKATCPTCGLKRVECERGVLRQHVFKGGSGYCGDRSYVGHERKGP
jgi:hypothetical protein